MKKLLLLFPFAALLLAACSNDFEVVAPWKEIPVTYAILDAKDTAQYVRVEKAFLDPEKSALEIAQIPDSLYYPENAISVFLERKSTGTRMPLTRVDGNQEGHVRESGIFANQPNWLYKFLPATPAEQLVPGEAYGLVIVRADGKPDITAETTLPEDFLIVKPVSTQTPPPLAFGPNAPTTFEWRTDENGVYFNITLFIKYREQMPNGQLIRRDTLEWAMVRNVRRGDMPVGQAGYRGIVQVSADQFYRFLAENIQPANSACGGCNRYFESIDMLLEGGGKEIESYLEAAAANSGITGAEIIPSYTNISEGFGLFTGKNSTLLPGIRITAVTVDSMRTNPTVGVLNFQN